MHNFEMRKDKLYVLKTKAKLLYKTKNKILRIRKPRVHSIEHVVEPLCKDPQSPDPRWDNYITTSNRQIYFR